MSVKQGMLQTHHYTDVEAAYQNILPFIRPHERVLWVGNPGAGHELPTQVRVTLTVAKFAIVLFAVSIVFSAYNGFIGTLRTSVFGIAFSIGVLVAGSATKQAHRLFMTYVLTDSRALRVHFDRQLTNLSSMPLTHTTRINAKLRGTKPTSIKFSRPNESLPRMVRMLPAYRRGSWIEFDGVEHPQYVLQVAQWAASQNHESAA